MIIMNVSKWVKLFKMNNRFDTCSKSTKLSETKREKKHVIV